MQQVPNASAQQDSPATESMRQPWETPALETLPLEATRAMAGAGADSNASSS